MVGTTTQTISSRTTDPDKSSASTAFVYATTIALAIGIALIIIMVYSVGFTPQTQTLLLWVIIPLASFILSVALNMGGQQLSCHNMSIKKALFASWPLPAFVYGAMALATTPVIRAPIVSLFTQDDKYRVEELENKVPVYRGLAVAYYVFFGVLFGQVISSGYSQVC